MKKEKLPAIENLKNAIVEKSILLSMKDRVSFPEILPQSGNKLQQIIVRSLISKIEFTPAEIKEFEIQFTQSGISWNKKAIGKEFNLSLTMAELSILKQASVELDKNGRITQQNLGIIEKIDSL